MGTLGSHGRRRKHQYMALLMRLFFTILPITRSLYPWELTSTTLIDFSRGARGSAFPRRARRSLPRSKRRSQRGDMTSGRCLLFDEISQSAETRGSGRMCSRPSSCQPMVPNDATPCGRPWEMQKKRRWRHFINTCKWAFYLKIAKNTKIGQFWSTIARAPLDAKWSNK